MYVKRFIPLWANPAGIYLVKVNNGNTIIMCKICSKLTIKTLEQHHCRRSGVFVANFTPCPTASIINFKHVIAGWEGVCLNPVKHL